MRPSMLIQYIAFASAALAPWFSLLQLVSFDQLWPWIAGWAVVGVVAALWNRNMTEV